MPNISYISKGQGEIILFLHGWGQSKEKMFPLIEELEYKYKCIVIDLPGFGESSFNNSKTLNQYIINLRKFLNDYNIIPKYIVGHSFGGKVAIGYHLKYNDLKKVVVIASPLIKPKRTIKYYYKVLKYKLVKKLKIVKNLSKNGSEDYKNCKEEMKNFFVNVVNTHYDKELEKIDIPVLLIWGNKDDQVPLDKAKKMHKLIKNNELHIINGNHFAYLENIEYTRLVIQKFLRRK